MKWGVNGMLSLIYSLLAAIVGLIALIVLIPLGILSPLLLLVFSVLAYALLPIVIIVLVIVFLVKLILRKWKNKGKWILSINNTSGIRFTINIKSQSKKIHSGFLY